MLQTVSLKGRAQRGPIKPRFGELALPERMRQNGGVTEVYEFIGPHQRMMIHKAKCECKLDMYFQKGKIDKPEFDAGMRFRMAWLFKAEGVKTYDSTQERIGSGDVTGTAERQSWAEAILKQAYAELTPVQALVVVAVCGSDEFAGGGERLVTLHRGLDRLARLWNL